jgi:hypothetical protein
MATPKTTIAATTAINSKKVAVSAPNQFTTAKLDAIQASITENMSSIREAASAVNVGKIESSFGSSRPSKDLGSGGSTGGLLESIKTPGFDEGRVGGGNVSADPKDAPGTGRFSLSQNEKDSIGVLNAVSAGGLAIAGIVGATAGTFVGAAAAPAVVAGAAIVGIGFVVTGTIGTVLQLKGTPVPDAITGTFSGVTVGKNGVSFDPLTGMGPAKIQTLGQFTGDQTGWSGVLMTQAEVRGLIESFSKASGSYEKNPNPMSEPVGSVVADGRDIRFMVGGGAAGPIMGGGNWLAGVSSASQFQLVATDALLA